MRIIIPIIIFFTSALLFSCEEKEIGVFNHSNQIYFEKFYINEMYPGTHQADSTVSSFFFYSDDTQDIEANLIVNLAGKVLDKDQKFKLKVVAEETTALPEEYTIQPEYTFNANNYKQGDKQVKDTIKVIFHRSDRLASLEQGIRLVVELEANEFFELGQYERRRAVLISTNQPTKPKWWDNEIESYSLGKYSNKKYKLFLNNVEGASELNEDMKKNRPDKVMDLALKFKKWLNSQDPKIIDEDGSIMSVTI